jgi:hypothetical protein
MGNNPGEMWRPPGRMVAGATSCHHDRTNGGCHCHTGKLAGRSFPTKEAAQKALEGAEKE